MTRIRSARPAEIEAIYRDRFRVFVLSATAMLGDGQEALDAVQEGFARAIRQRHSFRADGSLEGWLWRIVLNVARDRLRDEKKARAPSLPERLSEDCDAAYEGVRERLHTLPERQRLAVFLRYYADLSYDEIAEALGVRPGTVAASLHAAHTAMRRDFEGVTT